MAVRRLQLQCYTSIYVQRPTKVSSVLPRQINADISPHRHKFPLIFVYIWWSLWCLIDSSEWSKKKNNFVIPYSHPGKKSSKMSSNPRVHGEILHAGESRNCFKCGRANFYLQWWSDVHDGIAKVCPREYLCLCACLRCVLSCCSSLWQGFQDGVHFLGYGC